MADVLMTPRLEVRPLTAADVDAVFAVHSDPETMAEVSWRIMTSRTQAEDRVAWELANEADTGFGIFLIHQGDTDVLVGVCGAMRRGDGLEVGWTVTKSFQGRGCATEAASALVAAIEATSWPELFATIRPTNRASQRVAEKLGFALDAKVTDDHGDLLIYRRPAGQDRAGGH